MNYTAMLNQAYNLNCVIPHRKTLYLIITSNYFANPILIIQLTHNLLDSNDNLIYNGNQLNAKGDKNVFGRRRQ